jgi:hypothetical protein
MKKVAVVFIAVAMILAGVGKSFAAVDFQEELKKLAEANAKGYVGPFATAFGTAMNSGLYHTAKPHALLGFDISAKISLVQVNDEDLVFDFIVPTSIPVSIPGYGSRTLDGTILYPDRETPTMFGESEEGMLTADSTSVYNALIAAGLTAGDITNIQNAGQYSSIVSSVPVIRTPPGLGVDMVPLFMPQVSVGLPLKTEVLVRLIPETDAGDFGKVKFLGLGIKHSISQWIPIPLMGIDITGQYATQKLTLGPIESNNTAFNLQVSRKLGLLFISITPYAGFGMESSSMKVDYTIDKPGDPLDGTNVAFDMDGDNTSRLTVGARLGLAFLTINADYSMGEYNAATLGIGLTIR